MVEPKMGFQTDAFNGLSYWLAFAWPRFDWLTAPTIKHHFENPPKLSALLSLRMPHERKTRAFLKKIIDLLEIFKLKFKFHASISAE